jgi:hypothetical protein
VREALERARRQEAEQAMQEVEEVSEESSSFDSVFENTPSKRKYSGSSGGSAKKKSK